MTIGDSAAGRNHAAVLPDLDRWQGGHDHPIPGRRGGGGAVEPICGRTADFSPVEGWA
jgi:hypothetical protein